MDADGQSPYADDRKAVRSHLTSIVDSIREWRSCHLQLAEKFVGDRPGTGGTDGVRYLAARAAAACPTRPAGGEEDSWTV